MKRRGIAVFDYSGWLYIFSAIFNEIVHVNIGEVARAAVSPQLDDVRWLRCSAATSRPRSAFAREPRHPSCRTARDKAKLDNNRARQLPRSQNPRPSSPRSFVMFSRVARARVPAAILRRPTTSALTMAPARKQSSLPAGMLCALPRAYTRLRRPDGLQMLFGVSNEN